MMATRHPFDINHSTSSDAAKWLEPSENAGCAAIVIFMIEIDVTLSSQRNGSFLIHRIANFLHAFER